MKIHRVWVKKVIFIWSLSCLVESLLAILVQEWLPAVFLPPAFAMPEVMLQ